MEITLDKLAKDVADKALNDIKLDGKTIREWVVVSFWNDRLRREVRGSNDEI